MTLQELLDRLAAEHRARLAALPPEARDARREADEAYWRAVAEVAARFEAVITTTPDGRVRGLRI